MMMQGRMQGRKMIGNIFFGVWMATSRGSIAVDLAAERCCGTGSNGHLDFGQVASCFRPTILVICGFRRSPLSLQYAG